MQRGIANEERPRASVGAPVVIHFEDIPFVWIVFRRVWVFQTCTSCSYCLLFISEKVLRSTENLPKSEHTI